MKKLVLLLGAIVSVHFADAQAWIQRTNFGGLGRHRASGFAIGNKGYLGIGHVNGNNINIVYKDWWEYDPSSDSWTQKANYPVNAGNYGAIAFSTDTRGYVGGGATLAGEFYEYNPQTNTWTQVASCPGTPGDQGCFSVDNKGYVIQGSLLWEYDPASDTWTSKQNAPMTFTNWCCGFSIGSSGYIKNGPNLYEYKPANDQWLLKASFPGLAYNGCGALVRNNRAYIITGYINALTNVTSEVWEYNPGNNSWERMNDFLGTSRRFSVAFSIHDRGYFGTGTNGINFNDFWEMTDAVSTDDAVSEVGVAVFPNPVETFAEVTIADPKNRAGELRVYDLSGNLVSTQPVEQGRCRIERNDAAAGIYIYQLLLDGRTVKSGKLIYR